MPGMRTQSLSRCSEWLAAPLLRQNLLSTHHHRLHSWNMRIHGGIWIYAQLVHSSVLNLCLMDLSFLVLNNLAGKLHVWFICLQAISRLAERSPCFVLLSTLCVMFPCPVKLHFNWNPNFLFSPLLFTLLVMSKTNLVSKLCFFSSNQFFPTITVFSPVFLIVPFQSSCWNHQTLAAIAYCI